MSMCVYTVLQITIMVVPITAYLKNALKCVTSVKLDKNWAYM